MAPMELQEESGNLVEFNSELSKLKESVVKIKALESSLYQEQSSYKSTLQKKRKKLTELKNENVITRRDYSKLKDELLAIETNRPTKVPFILWAALGPANLFLPDRERLQYKASYERFKIIATLTHLIFSIILLFVREHPWLDSISNFILLYAYSTMTLREHILRLNGSALKIWWIWHHYLCVILSGTMLVWPSGPSYYMMRSKLLGFMVYIAAVQFLQYRYQMNRLYTLRALSRVDPMQTTTDSATVHVLNSLTFLLPFILLGNLMQFYLSYEFWSLIKNLGNYYEWHLWVLSGLFGIIALGNLSTTLYTLFLKRHRNITAIKTRSFSLDTKKTS